MKPLCPLVWSTLKSLGLLRRTRGKRSGRSDIFSKFDRKAEEKESTKCYSIPTVMLDRSKRSTRFASHYPRLSSLIAVKTQSQDNALLKSKLCLWNARSICTKVAFICDYIVSEKISILAITGTWLKGDQSDNPTVTAIKKLSPSLWYCSHSKTL
jgi:hypothetical protein